MASVPDLKIVLEHLAGVGAIALGDRGPRAEPPYADYQQALKLAGYPNTYMKIHGMGEICPPPFPYPEIPPLVEMAYHAFGSRRMMWGSDFPPVSLRE